MKLLNTEFQDRIQQRTAEQIVNTSVPQVAEALVGVFKFFLQDRIQRFEKKTVEIPQPQIIEKIDETPEIRTAQEHSAVLAQLAPRLSGIMMKVDAGAGEDPSVKVKGLITRLIDKPYCDEETSTAAEKEDLEDDTAKHSSLRETVVPITESVNEGHPDILRCRAQCLSHLRYQIQGHMRHLCEEQHGQGCRRDHGCWEMSPRDCRAKRCEQR